VKRKKTIYGVCLKGFGYDLNQ